MKLDVNSVNNRLGILGFSFSSRIDPKDLAEGIRVGGRHRLILDVLTITKTLHFVFLLVSIVCLDKCISFIAP